MRHHDVLLHDVPLQGVCEAAAETVAAESSLSVRLVPSLLLLWGHVCHRISHTKPCHITLLIILITSNCSFIGHYYDTCKDRFLHKAANMDLHNMLKLLPLIHKKICIIINFLCAV